MTLAAIRYVVMGLQAFMRGFEYMELTFVAKGSQGERLGTGACYYMDPLDPSNIGLEEGEQWL